MPFKTLNQFLKLESASGIILFLTAMLALVLDNSPFAFVYQALLQSKVQFFINEGLMTLFFLLVGLELKREFLAGELAALSRITLSAMAALGGMLVPALIYFLINQHDLQSLKGWAVPVATDIAFALGVLSLFSKRVPLGLKLFLMALAIFDDIGAILIIAIVHTASLSYLSMLAACLILLLLWLLNRRGVENLAPYLLLGSVLWLCVFKSGVHATVAGVVLAFFIPLRTPRRPLQTLEDCLHPWVAYLVMPAFAFANAGISFANLPAHVLTDRITLGVMLGLFIGKQIGVFCFVRIMTALGWARLPDNTSWLALYAVAILCGIGFTMSLFLGAVSFQGADSLYMMKVRLGVLLGSFLSGIIGSIALHIALPRHSSVR